MRRSTGSKGIRTAPLLALAFLVSAASTSAQDAQGGDTAKAIRELTSEVRGLRTAIERTSESQLQSQILGLYLNLQQNRLMNATARLDAVRRELEALGNSTRELTQNVGVMEAALPQETDPVRRRALEQQLRDQKQELERLAAQEEQIKARETEAYQSSQTEEARWTDLINRLEQLLKK